MKKVLFLLTAFSLLTACGGTSEEPVAVVPDETISMEDMAFLPKAITVKVGDTVEWINDDNVPHTVTGSDFDSGEMAAGVRFTHTFDQPGTFDYSCTIHPSMKGTINVQ